MNFDENYCEPELIKKGYRNGYIENNGYIFVRKPSHPNASKVGYVQLHRLVMEKKLQRHLSKEEFVHHKDRNRKNNNPENLEVVSSSDHRAMHNREDKSFKYSYDVEELKRLYLSGKTTREISKLIGTSKTSVGFQIKRLGISRTSESGSIHLDNPLNARKITDEQIKEINNLRENGTPIKEIIKRTGYSANTIYKYLDKKLVPSRG